MFTPVGENDIQQENLLLNFCLSDSYWIVSIDCYLSRKPFPFSKVSDYVLEKESYQNESTLEKKWKIEVKPWYCLTSLEYINE